jgi:iron(III) transport system substrate-binding protein
MRIIPLLAALLIVTGCGGKARVPIVVYSPHGKELLAEFERRYEAAHPDHDVQWLDMGSQDAYDRIRTERQNPQADVWWGAPMTTFEKAAKEGLLERYVPAWDSAVPPEFKSAGGFWYGTYVTPEVIMYNNRLLSESEAPRDWDDLLDPRWRGKIIIRAPLASGTMRIIFSALIEREREKTGSTDAGFSWLRGLDANTKSYAPDPTQLYLKIAREEGLVTVWDLPDVIVTRRTYGYPFGYVVPRSGTPLITDCIAIVKGAKHVAEAREFYEFVTSVESMRHAAEKFYRIPSRNDIPRSDLPAWITSLNLTPMHLDWSYLADHEREWMKIWDDQVKGSGKR